MKRTPESTGSAGENRSPSTTAATSSALTGDHCANSFATSRSTPDTAATTSSHPYPAIPSILTPATGQPHAQPTHPPTRRRGRRTQHTPRKRSELPRHQAFPHLRSSRRLTTQTTRAEGGHAPAGPGARSPSPIRELRSRGGRAQGGGGPSGWQPRAITAGGGGASRKAWLAPPPPAVIRDAPAIRRVHHRGHPRPVHRNPQSTTPSGRARGPAPDTPALAGRQPSQRAAKEKSNTPSTKEAERIVTPANPPKNEFKNVRKLE